ncbi:hypothetical protein [Brevundimonas sp. TWP2-3-4b2]|uniref:hypothetical protein n=1 Tax=Brevundimonas sp. TWP2-3-4b2 TaxID=2804595 RepID=UPI003CF29C93
MASVAHCMFSGEPVSNDEHIIPKWMQRRYNLANQTYHLPNGSKIAYRNAKVPVAEEHNSKFSEIEGRISDGSASLKDIYLWAFQIHIGLIYKDSALKVDIKNPGAETFWNVDDFDEEIQIFRQLYSAWRGGLNIEPKPFGSVFVLDAVTPEDDFDFIHDLRSGHLFFQLGHQIVFVSLWDQCDGMISNIPDVIEGYRAFVSSLPLEERQTRAYVGQRVWACEAAYVLYRSRRQLILIKGENALSAVPKLGPPRVRPPQEAELASFCRTFGLRLVRFGGEVGNAFESYQPD